MSPIMISTNACYAGSAGPDGKHSKHQLPAHPKKLKKSAFLKQIIDIYTVL